MYYNARLSQNFLNNKRIINKIIDLAQIKTSDCILEIGPGQGQLTTEMVAKCGHLTAVEIDFTLVQYLQSEFKLQHNFQLIHADILKLNWLELLKNHEKWRLIANIPYHISSQIFFKILLNRSKFNQIQILVQKEFAKRVLAFQLATAEISALTITAELCFRLTKGFIIKGSSFYPQAKVDSMLLIIEPKPALLNEESLLKYVLNCFNFRRKTFAKIHKHLNIELAPELLKMYGAKRPQQISPDQWQVIFNQINNPIVE